MEKKKHKYLTEAHWKNSKAAIEHISKWQKHPPTLEEALKKQRDRENK